MATVTTKRFIALALLLVTLVLGIGAAILIPRLLHLDSYREQILAQAEQALGRRLLYETGEISYRFGPAFTFTKVVVKEKDSQADFITTERLTFKIAILPLLKKQLVVRDLVLEKPAIALERHQDGSFNFSDLLESKGPAAPLQVRGIHLKEGSIRFTDYAIDAAAVVTALGDTDLVLGNLRRGRHCDIKLSAMLSDAGRKGALALAGSVKLAPQGQPLTESQLNVKVLARELDTGHYWPYYRAHVPFRKIVGQLDIDSTLKGKVTAFTSGGSLTMRGLVFDYPQIFHAVLTPRNLHFHYDMELTPRDVLVKSLDLTVNNLNVKGSCAIRDIGSGDPRITARAVTSRFRLEEFRPYIPYGVIVKDTADYIEQHVMGGTYKLDDGRLDGRVSQIVHMERGTNYNVLFITGKVENGLVTYGPPVPTFNNIRGELEMRGKDFSLRRMSGNFGASPFTLDGKITDYPLDTPSGYPFTMNITPRQGEVAWLLGWIKRSRPTVQGDSRLHLAGEGTSSNYRLSGDWDLSQAAVTCSDVYSKPAGRTNSVSFRGVITKEEAQFTAVQFNLAPLSLALSGRCRFAGPPYLALDLKTNQFQIGDLAAVFPHVRVYQAGGWVRGTVHGEGSVSDPGGLKWRGTVKFDGFSCKPGQRIKTVSNVNGEVTFNDTTLETSQLTARLGSSTISGRGRLIDFKRPTLSLIFSSPSLDLGDLGYHANGRTVRVNRLQGDVSLKDGDLEINYLTGQFHNSTLAIRGTVIDLRSPKADLVVTSPYLETNDILVLADLKQDQNGAPSSAGMSLKATLSADSGKVGDTDIYKLSTVVIYEGKILYLQPLECALLGGRISGKGRADFSSPVPRWQIGFNLNKVSAEQLLKAAGVQKQEVTGTLTLQGELTGRGKERPDLKKSVLGSVRLHCEEGTLRRFPVLSKIFSILNVSQLLKFQLPDMVSGGMPYDHIDATFSFRDGVVATNDLYVASDAINISAVGKADLVKEEINATVGVQPLQSIDKVVSRIPIVGWVLTGSDRSFVTAYFEAKGKLDDPTVKAIPVKSMAKGVLNVFKRLFELPAKLITDTGEVIINK
ncbi:MAG TPA: AsmA-like C-terminal domain-containing protein [Geobacteraceae bacterium]